MPPRAPDATPSSGKAWAAFFPDNTDAESFAIPGNTTFQADVLKGMSSEERFTLFSTSATDPDLLPGINKKIDELTAGKYEFDLEGNFVEKTGASDVSVNESLVPDSVTPENFNANLPAAKKQIQEISNKLKNSQDLELQTLGQKIEDMLNNKEVPNLSKTQLDQLKKIINDSSPAVKGKLSKVGEIVGNNKVFFAIFAAYLCYEGYNRRKNRAEENREKCIEECKPKAYDAWSMGAITTEQLTTPPEDNENTVNCEETCWNTTGSKADKFCTATLTPTPTDCETYCTTECNSKYPLPDPNNMFSSENLGEGANELGDNALDTAGDLLNNFIDSLLEQLKNLFSGNWITWVFIGILGIILLVIGGTMLSRRSPPRPPPPPPPYY